MYFTLQWISSAAGLPGNLYASLPICIWACCFQCLRSLTPSFHFISFLFKILPLSRSSSNSTPQLLPVSFGKYVSSTYRTHSKGLRVAGGSVVGSWRMHCSCLQRNILFEKKEHTREQYFGMHVQRHTMSPK